MSPGAKSSGPFPALPQVEGLHQARRERIRQIKEDSLGLSGSYARFAYLLQLDAQNFASSSAFRLIFSFDSQVGNKIRIKAAQH